MQFAREYPYIQQSRKAILYPACKDTHHLPPPTSHIAAPGPPRTPVLPSAAHATQQDSDLSCLELVLRPWISTPYMSFTSLQRLSDSLSGRLNHFTPPHRTNTTSFMSFPLMSLERAHCLLDTAAPRRSVGLSIYLSIHLSHSSTLSRRCGISKSIRLPVRVSITHLLLSS